MPSFLSQGRRCLCVMGASQCQSESVPCEGARILTFACESSCEVLGYCTALYIFNKATWPYNIKANIHFARVVFFYILLLLVLHTSSGPYHERMPGHIRISCCRHGLQPRLKCVQVSWAVFVFPTRGSSCGFASSWSTSWTTRQHKAGCKTGNETTCWCSNSLRNNNNNKLFMLS